MSGSKLSIVGAGSVGATLAYASLIQGVARTVALYDINTAKVEAEVLDLAHGIQFMPQADVLGSDDVAVCADSDIVVITAGAKQKPGQSRLELAATTIGLMDKILPPVMKSPPMRSTSSSPIPSTWLPTPPSRSRAFRRPRCLARVLSSTHPGSGTGLPRSAGSPLPMSTPTSLVNTATRRSLCGRRRASGEFS